MLGQVSKGWVVLTCGGSTIMRFFFVYGFYISLCHHSSCLHGFSAGLFQCQGGVSRLCVRSWSGF